MEGVIRFFDFDFRLDVTLAQGQKMSTKYSIVTWHSSTLYLALTHHHFLLRTPSAPLLRC